jgi:hypothetical protein
LCDKGNSKCTAEYGGGTPNQEYHVSGSPCDGAGIRTVQDEFPSARSRTGDKSNKRQRQRKENASGNCGQQQVIAIAMYVQSSMEEDENDTARNLNNEEEEEVNSVASADSCHDTDGDYTGSENKMGAEITNDQCRQAGTRTGTATVGRTL